MDLLAGPAAKPYQVEGLSFGCPPPPTNQLLFLLNRCVTTFSLTDALITQTLLGIPFFFSSVLLHPVSVVEARAARPSRPLHPNGNRFRRSFPFSKLPPSLFLPFFVSVNVRALGHSHPGLRYYVTRLIIFLHTFFPLIHPSFKRGYLASIPLSALHDRTFYFKSFLPLPLFSLTQPLSPFAIRLSRFRRFIRSRYPKRLLS